MNMREDFLKEYPKSNKSLVVMSGGLDSAIAARLAIEAQGVSNVEAVSFFYKQKQNYELELAQLNCKNSGINHTLIDISFLGDISKSVSSNILGGLEMPTIQDILGDAQPVTEVPNRNAIMFMIAASLAQVKGIDLIVPGVQAQDEYSYFDTTLEFIQRMNSILSLNRKHSIQIHAPFQGKNKMQEILLLQELDGDVKYLQNTLTCYNPNSAHESCGVCPSCAERLANFAKAGIVDPIKYSRNIDWSLLLSKYHNH